MRGATLKQLRKWSKASGADVHATLEWWRGLNGPERERASAEMRRRMAPKAEAAK
jgi:hypothetical protein